MQSYTEHPSGQDPWDVDLSPAMRRLLTVADPPRWRPSQIGDVLEGVIFAEHEEAPLTVFELMDSGGFMWEAPPDKDLASALDRAGLCSQVRITRQGLYRVEVLRRGDL